MRYVYIEVYGPGYLVLHLYHEPKDRPVFEDTYHSWDEVIRHGWFEQNYPIHISPDLMSQAGQDNTEWQRNNLRS